jgi:flagellar basal-body rod protein FlgF
MSTKGIYTALSGAMAQNSKLDTIANNIANSSTNAFKKDQKVFKEYLTANERYPDTMQVPRVTASIESFYNNQAGDRGYVDSKGSFTDFSQGSLRPTGNKLDFALEGKGFFEIFTPQGLRFTRNGSFHVNQNGLLVNNAGNPVLRAGTGQDPSQRTIQMGNGNITVAYNGEIYSQGQLVNKLSIVDFSDPNALKKEGGSNYVIKDRLNPAVFNSETAKVHQGNIEASNVNIVQEMTDMIKTTRSFEATQKAIKAFDSMNAKLMNEVPKLR